MAGIFPFQNALDTIFPIIDKYGGTIDSVFMRL